MKHRVFERKRVSYAPVLEEKTREPVGIINLGRLFIYLFWRSKSNVVRPPGMDVMLEMQEHTPFNNTLLINELVIRSIRGDILNHGT